MSTAKAAGKAPAKKSSVTTEVVMGKAAQDLHKAVAEALKATDGLKTMVEESENLALKIANQEDRIDELDVIFSEKERQLVLDLELKMKGRTEETVQAYLTNNRQRSISIEDFNQMEAKIKDADATLAKTVAAETAKVRNEESSRFTNELKLKEAQFAANEAKNNASISVLEGKVEFLEAQNRQLLDQINAERQASIERARAGAIGTLNVGSQNGGR